MTHCPNCTLPIENSSRFCGVCGTRIDEEEVVLPRTLLATQAPDIETDLFDEEDALAISTTQEGIGKTRVDGRVGHLRNIPAKTSVAAVARPTPIEVAPVQEVPTASAHPKTMVSAPPAKAVAAAVFDPNDPVIGQTLNNRFVIESKLGEGGFGAVYKGVQKGTNRIVAIKLLHPEMTRDSNVVERFRREGQVLCSLKDAHTVTTYDFDQTPDGTLFIAMELLEGRSLHDVFATEAPIDWRRMLKIITEMCSALAEAHAMGVVHRDLKPENVHLEKRPGNDEFVKILDFGIAKMLKGEDGGTSGPQLTALGQTLGTLEYMSPEQLMGKPLDGRSDVYAMGVLAHELITGKLPFPDAVGPALLITAQLRSVPPALSTVRPDKDIPPEVDALVLRMLEKTCEGRFENVTVLQKECQHILRKRVPATHTPPIGGSARGAATPSTVARGAGLPAGAAAVTSPASPATASIKTGGTPPWIWFVALAIVVAGSVAIFLLSR